MRRIYRWCVEEQLSAYAISQRLNGEEPGYERVPPRNSARWSHTTVTGLLGRPDYKGTAYYNRTRKDTGRTIGLPKTQGRGRRTAHCRTERKREEWIPIDVPPVVDTTLWEQAQVQQKMNKQFASRNNKRHFYLLRGLLVCGACGRTLAGRSYANGTVCPTTIIITHR